MTLDTRRLRRALITGAATAATLAATVPFAAAGTAARGRRSAQRSTTTTLDDGAPDAFAYGGRDDVVRFADETAAKLSIDSADLREVLAQARFQPSVVRHIMPPPAGTAKNWAAYRARFVEPVRVRAGVAFWRANERWLAKAEAIYGVPPEVVVGIVGVETIWGRQMGDFRVIDALATLSFDFPTGRSDRSVFFRDELESWIRLCRQEGVDPLAWRGSFAGAFGMPQFMPSSFLRFAIDFDADERIDLHRNTADVIGSVAHFLEAHGWQRGLASRYDVKPPTDTADRAALLGPDILPTFTAARMTELGAVLGSDAVTGPLALVELQNGDAAPSYVAGTTNFYAVTRYNRSSYYALAVLELGEAIRQRLTP